MNQNNLNDHSLKSFSSFLFGLSANELTILAFSLGFVIGQEIDIDEQGSLGNFFELLGQVLLSLNSQNVVIQNQLNPKK